MYLILAGNKDMHKSLDEFEFRPDPTTECGVTCPGAYENLTYCCEHSSAL